MHSLADALTSLRTSFWIRRLPRRTTRSHHAILNASLRVSNAHGSGSHFGYQLPRDVGRGHRRCFSPDCTHEGSGRCLRSPICRQPSSQLDALRTTRALMRYAGRVKRLRGPARFRSSILLQLFSPSAFRSSQSRGPLHFHLGLTFVGYLRLGSALHPGTGKPGAQATATPYVARISTAGSLIQKTFVRGFDRLTLRSTCRLKQSAKRLRASSACEEPVVRVSSTLPRANRRAGRQRTGRTGIFVAAYHAGWAIISS